MPLEATITVAGERIKGDGGEAEEKKRTSSKSPD